MTQPSPRDAELNTSVCHHESTVWYRRAQRQHDKNSAIVQILLDLTVDDIFVDLYLLYLWRNGPTYLFFLHMAPSGGRSWHQTMLTDLSALLIKGSRDSFFICLIYGEIFSLNFHKGLFLARALYLCGISKNRVWTGVVGGWSSRYFDFLFEQKNSRA